MLKKDLKFRLNNIVKPKNCCYICNRWHKNSWFWGDTQAANEGRL